MRSVIFISFMVLVLNSCSSGNGEESSQNNDGGVAEISFNELEYDFGKISEGEKVACIFKFKNTGDGDLVIHSATTSCGCTVPRFEDKPVAPGDEGTIEVVFDSYMREGIQTKTITVRSNAGVKVVVLRILAEVVGE